MKECRAMHLLSCDLGYRVMSVMLCIRFPVIFLGIPSMREISMVDALCEQSEMRWLRQVVIWPHFYDLSNTKS